MTSLIYTKGRFRVFEGKEGPCVSSCSQAVFALVFLVVFMFLSHKWIYSIFTVTALIKKEGRTTSNLLPKSNPRVGSKAKKTSATECLIITRPSYRKRVDITLLLFLWVTLYQ